MAGIPICKLEYTKVLNNSVTIVNVGGGNFPMCKCYLTGYIRPVVLLETDVKLEKNSKTQIVEFK
jgi:hypothetical protein